MTNITLEEFDTIDADIMQSWLAFSAEYGKVDTCRPGAPSAGTPVQSATLFKILVNNKNAGFVKLENVIDNTGKNDKELHLMYIKPEFRGNGIAESIYKSMIEQGVSLISLSWRRVDTLKLIDYWHNVGFKYIHLQPGQCGSNLGLVYLSTKPLPGPMNLELNKKNIIKARSNANRIAKKINRKRAWDDQNMIMEILSNHFGKRIAA